MAALAHSLQTSIEDTIREAQEGMMHTLEHRIQHLERRITDAETVLFEVTGQLDGDETQNEVSCVPASTARYCSAAKRLKY